MVTTQNIMYCLTRGCDGQYDNNPANAIPSFCFKCGGTAFGNVKKNKFDFSYVVQQPTSIAAMGSN